MADGHPAADHDAAGVQAPPYPITWNEQDRLFPRLPAHLQRMALFAVNTGLRDSNVCGLQWTWEVPLPELARSVFVVPAESFKSKRDHVVILNDAAWSIVQAQRGLHPIWVFPFRGHRIDVVQGLRNGPVFQCRKAAAGGEQRTGERDGQQPCGAAERTMPRRRHGRRPTGRTIVPASDGARQHRQHADDEGVQLGHVVAQELDCAFVGDLAFGVMSPGLNWM